MGIMYDSGVLIFAENTSSSALPHEELFHHTANITVQKEDFLAYRVGWIIHVYYLPFVLVFGLTGNILSLLVTLQRHNRQVSCCVFMAALAITDNMILGIGCLYYLNTVIIHGTSAGDTNCKVFIVIFQSVASYGVYVILLMTLDRCLAVRMPYRSKAWRTAGCARAALATLAGGILLVNLPYYFLAGYDSERSCVSLLYRHQAISITLYAWLYSILLTFLPCTAILVMNAIIILTLRRRRALFTRPKSNDFTEATNNDTECHTGSEQLARCYGRTSGGKVSRERQLTFILLFVSFALLLLTEPQYIRRIVYLASVDGHPTTPREDAMFHLVHSVTNKLFYTNNAINFYLYILASNKFRKDLFNIFKRRRIF